MELQEYLRILRERWVSICAVALLALVATAALTFSATPQYASSARLFVSTAQSGTAEAYQGGLFSAQRVTSYADLAGSRELAESVIADLRLPLTPGELSERVSAEVVPQTVILELTAVDPDPKLAQAIAQAYAERLADTVRELETPPGKAVPPIRATIVDAASEPGTPISPRSVRNLGLGLIIGLLLGVGLAVLRETLDTTVTSSEDFDTITEAPLLGAIAFDIATRSQPLITALDSHAPRVESFRVLRTNIQFVDVDRDDKVFVVTSALPEEGKTTTSVNLAITLAQAGHRTLLIEGDLRRPRAAEALGVDNAVGVTTVLVGKVTLDDAIQKQDATDLHVLGSGAIPPNPAELLQSNAMSELLTRVRERYDVVIVDAPPLLPVTDAALLATQSDGAMLVVRHGRTTKDQVAQSIERLRQVDAKLVGVVLNMVPTGRKRHGYGYAYGYGYGYGPADSETTRSKSKSPSRRLSRASRRDDG